MESDKKENYFFEGILLICAVAISASVVQIGFLLTPMSDAQQTSINALKKERLIGWKMTKSLVHIQNQDSRHGATVEEAANKIPTTKYLTYFQFRQ